MNDFPLLLSNLLVQYWPAKYLAIGLGRSFCQEWIHHSDCEHTTESAKPDHFTYFFGISASEPEALAATKKLNNNEFHV